jgi:hypothetical protein
MALIILAFRELFLYPKLCLPLCLSAAVYLFIYSLKLGLAGRIQSEETVARGFPNP